MNRFVNHVVRAHSCRTSRVILAELAFLGSLGAAIWSAIWVRPRCGPAEYIAHLGFIQLWPVLFFGLLMMSSTILTPRAQRVIVRRREGSIEFRIPIGFYLIIGGSIAVMGMSALSLWFIDPLTRFTSWRTENIKVLGPFLAVVGIYFAGTSYRVWIGSGTARVLRRSGFVRRRMTRVDGYRSIVVGGNSKVSAIRGGTASGWGSLGEKPLTEKPPEIVALPLALLNNPHDPLSLEEIGEICDAEVSVGYVWHERVARRIWFAANRIFRGGTRAVGD